MSQVTDRIFGFFQDENGNKSMARAATAVCIALALTAFICGLWKVTMAAYCAEAVNSFLYAGVAFYGFAKGQQAVSPWFKAKAEAVASTTQEITT